MGLYNDDLLFIHIPKTGGTAAKSWLQTRLPGATSDGFPIGHIPLRDVEAFTGRAPESFKRIVAIIRDPYAQQLSQWRFWRERYAVGGRHAHDIHAASCPDMEAFLSDPACDFHLWYESRVATEHRPKDIGAVPANGYEGFPGYYHYWLSVGGLIPANVHVVKLENIRHGWPEAVMGLVEGHTNPLPKINTGPSLPHPVGEYYLSATARRMVRDKFRWAFGHHYEAMR